MASTTHMAGKTVIVTGANSGIGLETAVALAAQGARVVMTARDAARGEAAVSEVRRRVPDAQTDLAVFDLASMASVRQGATDLLDRCPAIDVLVNNAGLVLSDRRQTVDGFETTFAVNHLGPFLLTRLLLGRILASGPARVVTVASMAHRYARHGIDYADIGRSASYRGMLVYGESKLANILFTRELARRLEGTAVTANCLHPGTVATGYARDGDTSGVLAFGIRIIKPFVLTAKRGARTSIYLASSPDVGHVSGEYFIKCQVRQPSAPARDAAAALQLWEASEAWCGLEPMASGPLTESGTGQA